MFPLISNTSNKVSIEKSILNDDDYNKFTKRIESEIIPFSYLKKYLEKKWSLTITKKEKKDFINDYKIDSRINEDFLEYLIQIKENENVLKDYFVKLKFSLGQNSLKKFSEILKISEKEELNFINTNPKERFYQIYHFFKTIIDNQELSKEEKINLVKTKILLLKNLFSNEDNNKYPLIMGSNIYQYNKIFKDFIAIFYDFTFKKYIISGYENNFFVIQKGNKKKKIEKNIFL